MNKVLFCFLGLIALSAARESASIHRDIEVFTFKSFLQNPMLYAQSIFYGSDINGKKIVWGECDVDSDDFIIEKRYAVPDPVVRNSKVTFYIGGIV